MLEYARWKYWLVGIVLVVALILALPNVFGEQDALQVSTQNGEPITAANDKPVTDVLARHGIRYDGSYIESGRLTVRFNDRGEQLKARDAVNEELSASYRSALAKSPNTPAFLRALGLKPLSLGLDLRGGLYLLYEVDLSETVAQLLSGYEQSFRHTLNDDKIGFGNTSILKTGDSAVVNTVRIMLASGADAVAVQSLLARANSDLAFNIVNVTEGEFTGPAIDMVLSPKQISARRTYAIEQNRTTLNERVNQLGVSEVVVQQQGATRLNVQIPNVSDSADVKEILGKVASLEFRLEAWQENAFQAKQQGRAPLGTKLYDKDGVPVLLKRDLIATGADLTNATTSIGNQGPEVNVTLNGKAGDSMMKATRVSVGKRMAVVYIEKTRKGDQTVTSEKIISLATIQAVLSNTFRITGLTASESRELALLMRSGSLAAPMFIVEERAIGASLGQANIQQGVNALLIGMLLVFVFMAVYYRSFGWIANLVLLSNVVLLAALLFIVKTALSLPGIAGIVLTVGMAVDANILIYERIREELRNGVSPQAAIRAGFDKAFSAIADSNITTLIAGVVLWAFGTGAIRGFAVVLTLGIATSMFTAIVGSRVLVTWLYGGARRVAALKI
jgi:preprotein translocase subunit SecD